MVTPYNTIFSVEKRKEQLWSDEMVIVYHIPLSFIWGGKYQINCGKSQTKDISNSSLNTLTEKTRVSVSTTSHWETSSCCFHYNLTTRKSLVEMATRRPLSQRQRGKVGGDEIVKDVAWSLAVILSIWWRCLLFLLCICEGYVVITERIPSERKTVRQTTIIINNKVAFVVSFSSLPLTISVVNFVLSIL